MKITKSSQAKEEIGNRVWWDDIDSRWNFTRSGFIEDVKGKNILIDGDWKWLPKLRNLRTTIERD